MNPFLRYLADKNSAHTHRQTDRQTPMTTRPCGLRRAGKNGWVKFVCYDCACIVFVVHSNLLACLCSGRYDANAKGGSKRWKANFRCALNSLQDVKEVKEESGMKSSEPYKVYQLLNPVSHRSKQLTNYQLNGSVKEPNISIFFFSVHHSVVFYF